MFGDSVDEAEYDADYDAYPPIKVALPCSGQYWNEDALDIEDIEEDFQGRDLVTFVCPVCNHVHKAYRLG